VKPIKITEVYEKSTRRQPFRDLQVPSVILVWTLDHAFDKSQFGKSPDSVCVALSIRVVRCFDEFLHGPWPTPFQSLLSCESFRSKLALLSAWLGQLRSRSRQIWGSKVNR